VRRNGRAASIVGVAALVAGVAACDLTDKRSVTLQLSAAGNCVRTSITCGGEIGVFVVDVTPDAGADAAAEQVLETRCVPFAADPMLALDKLPAALENLDPPLMALAPGRTVAVEVVVYSPASGKSCPRYAPNATNNAATPSYYGRSTATAIGGAPSINVSLSCLPSTCLPCTKSVSPTGTDPVDGGAPDGPFKTVQKLVASLTSGQTGCLEDGTYAENVTFTRGGGGATPITLAAAPGAHPILRGTLKIPETTDNIAIVNLTLDGAGATSKSASPLVRGDRVALRGNDITNAGYDCVTLGDPTAGAARLTMIEGNRIHGCKTGVLAQMAESGTIAHNFIYDNTGDGVAFLPNGDSFVVEHNVLDGNGGGVLFGSDGNTVSTGDAVRLNVISFSTGFNVNSVFPGAAGTGNSATQNCLWMGAKGDVVTPGKGFSVKDNLPVDPLYVDRAMKDFHLQPTSPCKAFGPLR
jgi:hypothetical protein